MTLIKNHFFGFSSVFFLIVGTSIGAGMLTLPTQCHGLSLVGVCFLFCTSAFMMHQYAKYYIALASDSPQGGNILSFIKQYDNFFYWPTQLIYLSFLWGLLAAYLTSIAHFLSHLAPTLFVAPLTLGAILVSVFLLAPPVWQSLFNKLCVGMMLVSLTVMSILGTGTLLQSPIHWAYEGKFFSWSSFLLVMLSFGYHLTIPSFTKYLPNKLKLTQACAWGVFFVLCIYGSWVILILSLADHLHLPLGDPLTTMEQLAFHTQKNWLLTAVGFFSLFASITSCLGVSLGMYDYLHDAFPRLKIHKATTILSTLGPSLVLLAVLGQKFLLILKLAGFFGLYLLVFLPSWLTFKKEKKKSPLYWAALGLILGSGALLEPLLLG